MMSNVVKFLEVLGRNPGQAPEESYAKAVAEAGVDESMREVLLKRDGKAIAELLGGRATILAFIFPAEQEPDGDGKDGDPQPDNDQEGPEHVQEQSVRVA